MKVCVRQPGWVHDCSLGTLIKARRAAVSFSHQVSLVVPYYAAIIKEQLRLFLLGADHKLKQ